MNNQVYPASTAQFRILKSKEGIEKLQLRYVNITQGYASLWQDIPVILEVMEDENRTKPIESRN